MLPPDKVGQPSIRLEGTAVVGARTESFGFYLAILGLRRSKSDLESHSLARIGQRHSLPGGDNFGFQSLQQDTLRLLGSRNGAGELLIQGRETVRQALNLPEQIHPVYTGLCWTGKELFGDIRKAGYNLFSKRA
jgi:hypothetical protein